MEKINFYQPKIQFLQAEIRFLLKRLLHPNFKILKQFCFYQTENSFPLAGMKSSLKKCFPREKLFSLPGISDQCKKCFFTSQKLGAMKFFCKNWVPHNFNNSYHKQKEYYNTKEYYSTQTENNFTAFLSAFGNYYSNQEKYSFLKITFFLPVEIRGNPVFKK